ncbi:DNA-repair protein BRCA2 domain-containing protein [Vairimorpha necatrix]|uniref:DNA-repair protein BRCA2 domain-containing protein n=1 Tax=Vairimorpha necatrix TaxID=6039 RepID=A0AAX4JBB0_9MICR
MSSDEDFEQINFSCPEADSETTDHSELLCDVNNSFEINTNKSELSVSQTSEDEKSFFSSVTDAENLEDKKEQSFKNCAHEIDNTNFEDEANLFFSSVADVDNANLEEEANEDEIFFSSVADEENEAGEDNSFFSSVVDADEPNLEGEVSEENLFFSSVADVDEANENEEVKRIKIFDDKKDTISEIGEYKSNVNSVYSSEVGFKTGNNRKLVISADILNRAPNFSPLYKYGPIRSYNCPQKGHISTELDEKNRFLYHFNKIKEDFKKTDPNLLIIQYRWAWLNLFINKQIELGYETTRLLKISLTNRINSEYSIIRRIIEGDDVSYRYMIVLVLNIYKDILEVYDGNYSCKIKVDALIMKLLESKKFTMGFKIKLFGCKLLINPNKSIFEYDDSNPVMSASYNSFDFALPNRVLGYRKKISFIRNIRDIKKEGGIISCLKGQVKRIIESRYVVQVKGYRNSVENLETELENIKNLIEKTREEVTNEDVKIRKYVRFIFEDLTGECLVTSWTYTDEIKKDRKMILCGLKPVLSALGLHLTTCKNTYIKFCN